MSSIQFYPEFEENEQTPFICKQFKAHIYESGFLKSIMNDNEYDEYNELTKKQYKFYCKIQEELDFKLNDIFKITIKDKEEIFKIVKINNKSITFQNKKNNIIKRISKKCMDTTRISPYENASVSLDCVYSIKPTINIYPYQSTRIQRKIKKHDEMELKRHMMIASAMYE
jgi:hypothetical protein